MSVEKRKKRFAKVVSAKKAAMATSSKASKAFRLPDGVEQFRPKKGSYKLNFLSFVAGKGNPSASEGEPAICRPYHVHRNVGPNKDTYGCNARNHNKPCPICEYIASKDGQLTKEEYNAIGVSQRELWLLEDLASPGTVKAWDWSHHMFAKELFGKTDRQPQYESFADDEEGYTLLVGFSEKAIGNGKALEGIVDGFEKRKPVATALLDQTFCLDDCIVEHPYEEVQSAFFGGSADDHEEEKEKEKEVPEREEAPAKAKVKKVEEEPEEEDEDGEDDGGVQQRRYAKGDTVSFEYKGKTWTGEIIKILADDELAQVLCDGREKPFTVNFADLTKTDDEEPEDEEDEDEDEDEEEDEKPVKKKKPAPVEEEPEDEEDEDEDEEEEEEPAPKKKKAAAYEFKAGDMVTHPDHEKPLEVIRWNKDHTTLELEDDDMDRHTGISPADCTLYVKPSKKAAPVEEEEEEEDDEIPVKKKKK